MLSNFSQQQQQQQQPTTSQQQSHPHSSGHTLPSADLSQEIFEGNQPQAPRKRGGRGPGKKDVDRPSISVRWEEGDLTERLIQALERPDKQWHAVIAQVGPEHTRVVIGVPKRDLQREIARHLFANDSRYDLEDKRTIEPLAVSVKNKLFKIVNLYQDCERDLGEWLPMINDERDVTNSTDPNLAAAWGRVKEKLPQFFRVRDLIKRTQSTTPVATNSISSSGQTSPTRTTAQNPQVRATTQAPQVIPTPQTPRHPASGSLGESSTGATRPSAMQGATGHSAANVGLNLSGPHSPATRNFVQQPQQHGGNIGFGYGMPSNVSQPAPHLHTPTQQQLQQQQQQFQQQQSQHHQAQQQQQQQQRLQHPQHQGPHQLSIRHGPYAPGSGAGPASASAPSPSFPAPQSILTRSPALPPPPAPPSTMAAPSTQRPPSGHARAPSVTRTTGGPSHASPRHSASPSPPPVSPPLSASVIVKFVEAHESRKRKREEDWFALKRMRYEERERERTEREKQRQHERDMMRLRIELARASRGEGPEILDGETELEHLGLREAPG
ncbi:hypothetical protein RSOLAG22IIIB_03612 [Rhizoctonia solani]|uniref:Uncharacterized protein n=1 Tax=Rhizoctonia solani TaxID=456999 RepID=A0A0K6FRY2_9AGAM|nr:hypothetical protein RSOLAG22IIIB_03612 [Rhizoctonia solani]